MPSVEERLAYLEGRIGDHVGAITDIRTDIRALRGEMGMLRGEINDVRGEMNAVRGEVRGLRSDMHTGFETLRSTMDQRFESSDAKISRLIGIQVAMLMMIASAALAYFFK